MKKSLFGANVSMVLTPSIYFLLSILLFVLALRTGVGRISEQRNALSQARKTQVVLEQKESLLRQIETEVSSQVDVLANVLPEKNPALIMISQVKNLAAVSGITITTFKTGAQTEAGAVSFVNLSFDAESDLLSLISFLNTLKTLAPLSTIEKARINQQGGATSANISVRIYFAGYPSKLPNLTEAANDLSAEEKDLLGTLSGLTLPAFSTLTPQGPSIRESPFN